MLITSINLAGLLACCSMLASPLQQDERIAETTLVRVSCAERAGIRVGDVIVTINGQPFVDPLSLASYFQDNGMDEQLILKILRKGAEQTITIQVPDQNR